MAELDEVGVVAGVPTSGTGEVPTLAPVRDELIDANALLTLIEAVTTAVRDATASAFRSLLVDTTGSPLTLDGDVPIKGNLPHGDADTTPFPIGGGGTGNAAAPANVTEGDRVGSWHLLNGAQAAVITAAGALIPGDATLGLKVNVTAFPHPDNEYETVAAAQTAQVLGATGAAGDFLSHVIVSPVTTSPGVVTILDNATAVVSFAGGASSLSNLVPFIIPVGIVSTSGAWKITTGTNVSCVGVGNFT